MQEIGDKVVFSYVIEDAKMWTGLKQKSTVYSGSKEEMTQFLKEIYDFADNNKKGAKKTINNIEVSLTKKMGMSCITFKGGNAKKNTTKKAILGAYESMMEL